MRKLPACQDAISTTSINAVPWDFPPSAGWSSFVETQMPEQDINSFTLKMSFFQGWNSSPLLFPTSDYGQMHTSEKVLQWPLHVNQKLNKWMAVPPDEQYELPLISIEKLNSKEIRASNPSLHGVFILPSLSLSCLTEARPTLVLPIADNGRVLAAPGERWRRQFTCVNFSFWENCLGFRLTRMHTFNSLAMFPWEGLVSFPSSDGIWLCTLLLQCQLPGPGTDQPRRHVCLLSMWN